MKRLLLLFALCFTIPVAAQPLLQFSAGTDLPANSPLSDTWGPSYTLQGSLAYRIKPSLGITLRAGYTAFSFDEDGARDLTSDLVPAVTGFFHGTSEVLTVMGGVQYFITLEESPLLPYLVIALGYYKPNIGEITMSRAAGGTNPATLLFQEYTDPLFGLTAGAGLIYWLHPRFGVSFEARYVHGVSDRLGDELGHVPVTLGIALR